MKDYSFGSFICALRMRRGLSPFQLGTLVGVSNKAVSKWETGAAKPQISTCRKLAEVLGVVVPFIVRLGVYLLSLASPDGYIIP